MVSEGVLKNYGQVFISSTHLAELTDAGWLYIIDSCHSFHFHRTPKYMKMYSNKGDDAWGSDVGSMAILVHPFLKVLLWFGLVFMNLFYWVSVLQLDGYSFIDWACLETPTQSFSENPFKRVWNLLFLQFSQLLFFWSQWSKLCQTDICWNVKKNKFWSRTLD